MPQFGTYAPPPYREPAPDGQTYFKVLKPYLGLAASYQHALAVRRRYDGIPHPEAKLKSRLVSRLVIDLNAEVRSAEHAVSRAAEKSILARIASTRVRPIGKNLLSQHIECRPIGTLPFHTAAVGIADISQLDKVADDQGRSYWAAQEFGSSHLVEWFQSHGVSGYFQPGESAPSQSAFRQHPFFELNKGGYNLHVERPIPEKGFLRSGAADAEQFRYRTMTGIASNTIRQIEIILATQIGVSPKRKPRL